MVLGLDHSEPPDTDKLKETPVCLQSFLKKLFQKIGTEGTRLLREKWLQGRIPQAQKAPKRRIARGKRVPYAPINDQILQTLKKSKKHE